MGNVRRDRLRSRGSFEVEAHLEGTAGQTPPRRWGGVTVPWSRSREGAWGGDSREVPNASRGPGGGGC